MGNHRTSRRSFLQRAGLGIAGLALPRAPGVGLAEAEPRPPNIIFILADDLGYGDLGCYGQQRILTPRIDRMAEEGTRFTQVYAGAPVSAPSRCCLMTGLHNGHGRIRDNIPHGIYLQPDDVTVAEVLKKAGYRTGMIGKWSLGVPGTWGLPGYQGFDTFYGHLDQDQAHFYYPDHLWENDEVVLLRGNRGEKRGQYTHDLFSERALKFIESHKHKPFFLYLGYTIPHWSDFDGNTPESLIVPSDQPYSDRDWPQVEKNYAAMVTRMDTDVGRILDLLKQLGIEENTLVFFSSDNGPADGHLHDPNFFDSNGPLRGVKRDLYEGGIRVPMIARWPGRTPSGQVNDMPWAFWDVLPTLAEAAGLPAPSGIDGVSVLPTLLGEKQDNPHTSFYWDYGHARDEFLQAARLGNWKGVRNGLGKKIELYDLRSDIGETTDISEAHPEIVQQIEELMRREYTPSADYPLKTGTAQRP